MIQISSNTPGQTSSFLSYHDEADNTLIKSQHKFLKRFCCLSKSTYGHYIHDVLGNTFIFFVLSICSSSWSTHSRILLVLFHLFFSLLSYPLPTPACHLNDHEKPTQRVFGFSLGLVLSNWLKEFPLQMHSSYAMFEMGVSWSKINPRKILCLMLWLKLLSWG